MHEVGRADPHLGITAIDELVRPGMLKETPEDAGELAGEIQRSLATLRPEFRSVFVMFHEQGLSYEEIARVHERPVGTIKTWLHRTRMEVLDYLRKRGMVPAELNTTKIVPET